MFDRHNCGILTNTFADQLVKAGKYAREEIWKDKCPNNIPMYFQ
jgi:hypothetical protein